VHRCDHDTGVQEEHQNGAAEVGYNPIAKPHDTFFQLMDPGLGILSFCFEPMVLPLIVIQ
jgi:hypothetical protein